MFMPTYSQALEAVVVQDEEKLKTYSDLAPWLFVMGRRTRIPLLHEACRLGKAKAVRALLTNTKISPNTPDRLDFTPLHWAVFMGHEDTVKALLEDPFISPNFWKRSTSLFHLACERTTTGILALLEKDSRMKTFAANHTIRSVLGTNSLSALHLFIEEAERNLEPVSNGRLLLEEALCNPDPAMLACLARALGFNINAVDRWHRTILCIACFRDRPDHVKALLEVPGIDVNLPDNEGRSPLWHSLIDNPSRCTLLLLSHPSLVLPTGAAFGINTILSFTRIMKWDRCHQLLVEYSKDPEAKRVEICKLLSEESTRVDSIPK